MKSQRYRVRRVMKWVGVVACVAWTGISCAITFTLVSLSGRVAATPPFHERVWMALAFYWGSLIPLLLVTYILWRRDRRYPEGHCQGCGYDLTGNVSGVCSECGKKT